MANNKGKKTDQKMKPYLVYDYLMRNSDLNHVVPASELVGYLQECGFPAERRSVYRYIEEINKVLLLTQREGYGIFAIPKAYTIEEANELLQNDKEKTIVYDAHRKGFYIRKRQYNIDDIRLLVECVYTAKFIDEKRARRLANVVTDLVSEHQAEEIKHEAFLVDRAKTDNKEVYEIVSKINAAMSYRRNKRFHAPEKIRFKYTKYSIPNGLKKVERRRGEWYIVSPYKLLISEGLYYLIGYDEKMKKILNFRVDRIKDVELIGGERDGKDEFQAIDMESYLSEHFSMHHGKKEHVTIRAANRFLDAFVDRFGKTNAVYSVADDEYFVVKTNVAVSNQFFGWLCGFGNSVKIEAPTTVKTEFKEYLDKMRKLYY